MIRGTIVAAAAAAFMLLSAPPPAQAAVANPGLATAMPAETAIQDVHYRRYRHRHHYRHHRHYRPHYRARRHRQCWNERVRIRVGHHWRVRVVRRCGWRGRGW